MSHVWEKGEEHAECRAAIAQRDARIALLEERLRKVEERLQELEDLLGQNSRNSSRPPSTDPPRTPPRATKPPSGRQPGGQPGHPGHTRELFNADKVDRVVDVKPPRCRKCGRRLRGHDPDPWHHQVAEIPPIQPEVTDWRLHALVCACGTVTRAELPVGVPPGIVGPRFEAILGYMSGRARMTKRIIQEFLADIFRLDLSLGAIKKAEGRLSEALRRPVAQADQYAQWQKVAHLDETGWRQGNKAKAWLWVMVTAGVTIFKIHTKRGLEGFWNIARDFTGYLVSDRWHAYEAWSKFKRQVCWAHLLRHFQGFVDSGVKKAKAVGEPLLFEAHKMFSLWHRVRDGTLSRKRFQAKLKPIRREVYRLFQKGLRSGHRKTRAICEDLLRLWPALWTFARVRGVEPTNNAAEQAIRPAVVYRKSSYGTKSASGSRFIERIMTTVATLRQQKRNVLNFLTAVSEAENYGHRKPSLLPQAQFLRAAA